MELLQTLVKCNICGTDMSTYREIKKDGTKIEKYFCPNHSDIEIDIKKAESDIINKIQEDKFSFDTIDALAKKTIEQYEKTINEQKDLLADLTNQLFEINQNEDNNVIYFKKLEIENKIEILKRNLQYNIDKYTLRTKLVNDFNLKDKSPQQLRRLVVAYIKNITIDNSSHTAICYY